MPIIYPPPVIINRIPRNTTDIAICQALPTKAETLVCLRDLQDQEATMTMWGVGILLVIVILFVWCVCHD